MPAYGTQGAVTPSQVQALTPNHIFGIATNWFANRTPLFSRLAKVPDGNPVFQMVGHSYRTRTSTLGAAALVGDATLTLADASSFMAGDVLRLLTGEYVEITTDPTPGSNVVAIRRGVGGSTASAQTNGGSFRLVTNSRTGAEDNMKGISASGSAITQYMQTIIEPYSVGGGVQSNTAFPLVPGSNTPFNQFEMDAMQNAADDAEMAACYGISESNAATGGRAKMGGFKNILLSNVVTGPADAAAYKSTSFQRDLLTAPRMKGGKPQTVVVASNWMDAFTLWSTPLQKLEAGTTEFGVPVEVYYAPFLGGVEIWESSLLPPFTAFSMTKEEVRWRVKRAMIRQPLAKTGDIEKGMVLQELAIEIDNEQHHGWLEGVTAFSN